MRHGGGGSVSPVTAWASILAATSSASSSSGAVIDATRLVEMPLRPIPVAERVRRLTSPLTKLLAKVW